MFNFLFDWYYSEEEYISDGNGCVDKMFWNFKTTPEQANEYKLKYTGAVHPTTASKWSVFVSGIKYLSGMSYEELLFRIKQSRKK